MNPFTHTRSSRDLMPERVVVPGVEREEVDRLQEGFDRFAKTHAGYLRAMLSKGVVPYRSNLTSEERRLRRARGKRQRQARKIHR